MANSELLNYISQQRAAGQSDEQIKQALRTSGWDEAEITGSFQSPQVLSGTVSKAVAESSIWKLVAIGAGVILLVGAGIIFVVRARSGDSSNSRSKETAQNEKGDQTNASKYKFGCSDIVPKS